MTVDAPISVRFFVHADSPVPAQSRLVASRLDTLTEQGLIETYSFELWPKVISMDALGGDSGHEAIEMFEQAMVWADDEGLSISPPFKVRTNQWQLTGETDTRLHTPNMCLLVYEGDELCSVYPHNGNESVRTITSGLELLENGETLPTTDRERPETTERKPGAGATRPPKDAGGPPLEVER